jgi:hypothetical protein
LQCKQKAPNVKDFRVGITYGRTTAGDAYEGPLAAYTASISTVKLLLNVAITEKSHFLTTNIEYFYLGTPLVSPEYMLISMVTDWAGSKYLGIHIDYNREALYVTLSMPTYVSKALTSLSASAIGHTLVLQCFIMRLHLVLQAHNLRTLTIQPPCLRQEPSDCKSYAVFFYTTVAYSISVYASRSTPSAPGSPVKTEEVEEAATRLLQYLSLNPTFSIIC